MKRYFIKERIKSIIVAILMLPGGLFVLCEGFGFDILSMETSGEISILFIFVGAGMFLYGVFAAWNSFWGVNEEKKIHERQSRM